MEISVPPLRRVLAGPLTAVALVAAIPLAAGCQTMDDAGRVMGPADLVNDLAARLEAADSLTYSADYQLVGGATGSISQAQPPLRTAYTWPGGVIMTSKDSTARCTTARPRAQATCTLDPPPAPNTRTSTAVFADASRAGLVTPPVVLSLLTATALDQEAQVEQNDTTVAGRHATCVRVTQLANAATAAFDACITTEGIVGSFTGVLDGHAVDSALTRYRDGVDGNAFELPTGAGVIDRRVARN